MAITWEPVGNTDSQAYSRSQVIQYVPKSWRSTGLSGRNNDDDKSGGNDDDKTTSQRLNNLLKVTQPGMWDSDIKPCTLSTTACF